MVMVDLGLLCVPVGQSGVQKGQSMTLSLKIVIRHRCNVQAPYFLLQT